MLAPEALEPIDRVVEGIQALPWGAHAIAATVLVGGVVVWSMGRRVLRWAAAVLGAAIGAGCSVALVTGVVQAPGVPVLVTAGVGMVLGLLAALLAYKVATALAFGVVISVAVAMGVGVTLAAFRDRQPVAGDGIGGLELPEIVLDAEGDAGGVGVVSDELGQVLERQARERLGLEDPSSGDERPSATIELARGAGERIAAFFDIVGAEARTLWDRTPTAERLWVIVGAVGGMLLGVLGGVSKPRWSAATVTAMFGAGLVLSSGWWLVQALGPAPRWAEVSSSGWVGAWLVVSVVGIVAQLRRSGKADRAGGAPRPGPAGV
ncbi:MAG: hypothetical protein C0475_00080 [Planctomyces sp.]|nr:hypothetical protein [Planctomyces sp.]MBA4119326.1 hypothetical protein [Isosphaera sp.]